MRVEISTLPSGIKVCHNTVKQLCLHNGNTDRCVHCYIWAGHGQALLFEAGTKTLTREEPCK